MFHVSLENPGFELPSCVLLISQDGSIAGCNA